VKSKELIDTIEDACVRIDYIEIDDSKTIVTLHELSDLYQLANKWKYTLFYKEFRETLIVYMFTPNYVFQYVVKKHEQKSSE